MRTFLLIILLSTIGFQGHSQGTNWLNSAYKSFKEGNLQVAKAHIDSATNLEVNNQPVLTYYIRGFIYKDLFKADPDQEHYREEAIKAFLYLTEIDTVKQYEAETRQNLKFLASTYYNQAISAMASDNFERSEEWYEKFVTTIRYSQDTTIALKENKIKFYLTLGSAYVQKDRRDSTLNYFDQAQEIFHKVLVMDSLNKKANYNIGVLYYNKAVNMILHADFDEIDILSLGDFQDSSLELFKKSLPYMKIAYQLDPNDLNVIEGLAGIYFGLKDFEESNRYKEKLATLKSD